MRPFGCDLESRPTPFQLNYRFTPRPTIHSLQDAYHGSVAASEYVVNRQKHSFSGRAKITLEACNRISVATWNAAFSTCQPGLRLTRRPSRPPILLQEQYNQNRLRAKCHNQIHNFEGKDTPRRVPCRVAHRPANPLGQCSDCNGCLGFVLNSEPSQQGRSEGAADADVPMGP
jgi:hypothetical protein